jgi:methionine-gamma-lyase
MVYLETPVNPTMELIALRAIQQVARYCQRPRRHGVDIVVHRPAKGVGGFGSETGGAVIGSGTYCNLLMLNRKDFGGVRSRENACPILVYGLPTPAARMVNQQKSATPVAEFC